MKASAFSVFAQKKKTHSPPKAFEASADLAANI
jgi:hypothetical protein